MPSRLRPTVLAATALLTAVILVPVLAGAPRVGAGPHRRSIPADAVTQALAAARAAGSYHVAAEVQQTLVPRAVPSNVERGAESAALTVAGDIVGADRPSLPDARLTIASGGSSGRMDVRIVGGQAFIGLNGRWQAVDDPLGGSAPGGDYLGYLAAAKNISEAAALDTAAGAVRRLTFMIDGPAYAEQMRQRAEALLREQLPSQVTVKPQALLQRLSGQGELWLDEAGRPVREILHVSMPQVTDAYDATALITVDFSRFGEAMAPVSAPVADADGTLSLPPEPVPSAAGQRSFALPRLPGGPALPTALATLAMVAGMSALGYLMLTRRRDRRVYAAVCLVAIGSQVAAPLAQAATAVRVHVALDQRAAHGQAMGTALANLGVRAGASNDVTAADLADDARAAKLAAALMPTGVAPAGLRDCRSLYADLKATDDTDGDGIPNGDEWCTGTDYANADTDADAITDTLELAGFTAAFTQTGGAVIQKSWRLNPLNEDTNLDGLADGSACYITRRGTGLHCPDTDRDGIPDAWDEDADADGVPNGDDVSPWSVLPYRSLVNLSATGHFTDAVTYIDVQLQPQTAAHLRYGLNYLDWPSDDKGQVQDLDSSTDDVRLIPVLEITSPVAPSLASQYGIAVLPPPKSDPTKGYRLWVALNPVGSGGRVSAFGSRIAFTAQELGTGVQLTNGHLVWLTQAKLDHYVNCKPGQTGCAVHSEQSIIANFQEDYFRVTGLSVSQTGAAQVALYGTNAPAIAPTGQDDEAKVMTQLVTDLAPSFLGNLHPTLPEFNAGMASYGLKPAQMKTALHSYGHRDQALATTTMTDTVAFLGTNYVPCTAAAMHSLTPTLAVGYQDTNSQLDLSHPFVKLTNADDPQPRKDALGISVPIGRSAVSVMRRVQLATYACATDPSDGQPRWQALAINEAQNEIARRYKGRADESILSVALKIFGSYGAGRVAVVSVNGRAVPGVGLAADPATAAPFNPPGKPDFPNYVRTAYQLDQLLINLKNRGDLDAFRQWSDGIGKSLFWGRTAANFGPMLFQFILNTYRYMYVRALEISGVIEGAPALEASSHAGMWLKELGYGLRAFARNMFAGSAASEYSLVGAMKGGYEQPGASEWAEHMAGREASYFKNAAFKLSVVILVIVVIAIWISFAVAIGTGGLSPLGQDTVAAQAIAATLLAVLQFVIDTIIGAFISSGWGALITLAIFVVIFVIVGAITGDWSPINTYNHLTQWLAKIILFVDLYVNSPDIAAGPVHLGLSGDQSSTSSGSVVGNRYTVSTTMVTTLTANTKVEHVFKSGNTWFNGRQGSIDDVKKSWAFGEWNLDPDSFNGAAPPWTSKFSLINSAKPGGTDAGAKPFCDSDDTVDKRPTATGQPTATPGTATPGTPAPTTEPAKWKNCRNSVSLSFDVTEAGRNLSFPFLNQLEANLSFQACLGFAFYNCKQQMNYSLGPDKATAPDDYTAAHTKLYIDVVPGLDALWVWDVKDPSNNATFAGWNTDKDADAEPDAQEAALKLDPTKWDTDGDSLGDGFEVSTKSSVHADATKPDTDGDGLSDAAELNASTAPDSADSDLDGLSDGQELCWLDKTVTPPVQRGGWNVRLANGLKYFVCSDPNHADADRDGLLDSQEKNAGTSPWAPNTAPSLGMFVDPTTLHAGSAVTVLKPGDALRVALSLANTTGAAVDQPLTLTYDPGPLGRLTVGSQTGSTGYTPPVPSSGAGGLTWTFKPNNVLHAGESMTATLTGSVNASVNRSQVTALRSSVPYTDVVAGGRQVISATQQVLVDADNPTSTVVAPIAGQTIKGTAYTLGGAAGDPTSWVTKVEARIAGTGYVNGSPQNVDTGWQVAGGLETWAYTWSPLGADGSYTAQSRATDAVNHVETPGASTSFVVDNTPPGASFTSVKDGDVLSGVGQGMVTLTGTAADTLSKAPKVAGVAMVQLAIDGRPFKTVAEFAAPNPATANWSFPWPINVAAYGRHSLAVRAADALGQLGPVTTITVILDTLPPADMLSNAVSDVKAGQPVALLGHADDVGNVPLPARPAPLTGGTTASLDPLGDATTWLMPNGPKDVTTGLNATWLGDMNGDGRADLVVGMPDATVNGQPGAGRVAVVSGQPGGWPVQPDATALADAPTAFVGNTAGQGLGSAVAPAGDVNGDGLADVLVGEPANNRVYLIFGQTAGLGAAYDPSLLSSQTRQSEGKIFTVQSGRLGNWLAAAGDVNGDGFGDLLLGTAGSQYLVLGSDAVSGALGQAQTYTLDNTTALTRPIVAARFTTDAAGALALGLGDVNDDQLDDFAIASSGKAIYVLFGGAWAGTTNLTPIDPARTATASLTAGPPDGKRLVAPGDVNGDGLPDIFYSVGNTPKLTYGRNSGWVKGMGADVSFGGGLPAAPNGFLAGVGDVNKDRKNDLVLGTTSGRAYLILGSATLATNQPVQSVLESVMSVASAPYAAGADCNCDASSDLLVLPVFIAIGKALGGGGMTTAQSAAARNAHSELALGPAPAPREMNELPSVTTGARSANAGTDAKGAQTAPMGGDGPLGALRRLFSGPAAGSPAAKPAQSAGVVRYVDDDYCATCTNDGHAWGTTAFATIQSALDAAKTKDGVVVEPGVYAPAIVHGGKDYLTLRGVDADAVFIDAAGGTGITVFPTGDFGQFGGGIKGVQVSGFTILNAKTGIEVNLGAPTSSATLGDPDHIVLSGNVIVQTVASSNAVQVGSSAPASTSNVELRHNTLVSNAGGTTLVRSIPGAVDNKVYLYDNLFVALSNAVPLPAWYKDDGSKPLALNTHNGFAGNGGTAADWLVAPAGEAAALMTLTAAAFQSPSANIYRLGAASAARGKASNKTDVGYYNYHVPVRVDPTYCPKCANDAHVWGVDAFTSIQAAISSGAQQVLLEPGLFRERIYLVNGVEIFGTGAGHTVIAPPDASAGTLVSAEGIRDASVNLVTLAGDSHDQGLVLAHGADVTLQRSIVRNTTTAVGVTGNQAAPKTGATATLVNDTLVANANGVASTTCGNVAMRNTILAFHTGTALALTSCADAGLHDYNDYWRNGTDLKIDGTATDSPGGAEVFADPRFRDPNHHDYRPLADSPVVDKGDPRDLTPPGTGLHVDIGYVQSVAAAVYVSPDYKPQGLNDGLEYGVDAFNTIGQAIKHVPDLAGMWTVGVAPGAYTEDVALPSGVHLVGSGADQTTIDAGGSGSAVTIDGATDVAVRGFMLTNSGAADANVKVVNASNAVTLTHNVIVGGNGSGVQFGTAATGVVAFNTIVANVGTGLSAKDNGTWVQTRFNIVASNGAGLDNGSSAKLFTSYNLFYANTGGDAKGTVKLDPTDLVGMDPKFEDVTKGWYNIGDLTSPAIDAIPAASYQPVPVGGGDKADVGYTELLAGPVTLMFGQPGTSCGMGASGVAGVDVGLAFVADASVPVTGTLPTAWSPAALSTVGQVGSYWNLAATPDKGNGLYRLYTRPRDVAGNAAPDSTTWFRTSIVADGTPPTVNLVAPTNGATQAVPALTLSATASDSVPIGKGQRDNLARVYFLVDGDIVTATLQTAAIPLAGDPQPWGAVAVVGDGLHLVRAVAVDRAGNVAQTTEAKVTVTTPKNAASLTSPQPGSAVTMTVVSLVGYATFADTAGKGQVEVLVDGATQSLATLDTPAAAGSRWAKDITLASDGPHQLTLRASRTAGSSTPNDTIVTLTRDTSIPAVTLQTISGTVVDGVTLTGTASDTGTGVAGVAVSMDGGRSWQAAQFKLGKWSFFWKTPPFNDSATFPLRIRATNGAGGSQVLKGAVVVDNQGPTPFLITAAAPESGSHLTAPAKVVLAWQQPLDGSGVAKVYAAADQNPTTTPATTGAPLNNNSYSASFGAAGSWYVHLVAVDAVGNQTLRHYGPWFVEVGGGGNFVLARSAGQPTTWKSSIQVNGTLDVADGEWQAGRERLDIDPRPERSRELWASFDATDLYLGARGAAWLLGGTGYMYLDIGAGGTTAPWPGIAGTQAPEGISLPFAADYVIYVAAGEAGLLKYGGGAWQPVTTGSMNVLEGGLGDTELRISWSTLGFNPAAGSLKLLTFSVESGRVTSVFPTNQSVFGPWQSAYTWSNITQATVPNAAQPIGHHVELELASQQPPQDLAGPRDTVELDVDLENLDRVPLPGTRLVLVASQGLTLTNVDGAGPVPAPGSSWTLDLGALAPGPRATIKVTGQAAANLAAVSELSITARVESGTPGTTPPLAAASQHYSVDNQPPTVTIDVPDGGGIRSGRQQLTGTANDGSGGGVAKIEVRLGNGPWQTADGTAAWSAPIDVPAGGSLIVSARGVDGDGQVSAPVDVTLRVDNAAPTTTLDPVGSVRGGSDAVLGGSSADAAGGAITRVEVQVDDTWLEVPGPYAQQPDGTVRWSLLWSFAGEEGVTHRLAARSTDGAGNIGPATAAQSVSVDSILPVSTIEQPKAGAIVGAADVLVWGYADDGVGVAKVEVSLNGGRTWQAALLGDAAAALIGVPPLASPPAPGSLERGANKLYLPVVHSGRIASGRYLWALKVRPSETNLVIRSRAVDNAGNVEPLRAPVRVRRGVAAVGGLLDFRHLRVTAPDASSIHPIMLNHRSASRDIA